MFDDCALYYHCKIYACFSVFWRGLNVHVVFFSLSLPYDFSCSVMKQKQPMTVLYSIIHVAYIHVYVPA